VTQRDSSWTEKKIERLKDMWAGGAPARDIAFALQTSPNAVIGKASRLGLQPRENPVETKESRFERMIDLITDAPLGEPLTVADACKQVGLLATTGTRMWLKFMKTKGYQAQ